MTIPVLVVVLAAAASPAPTARPKIAKGGKAMTVEVVSADAKARTITVRTVKDLLDEATPTSQTLTVDPKASAALGGVNGGDRVTLTCKAEAKAAPPPAPTAEAQADADANCLVTGIEKLPAR